MNPKLQHLLAMTPIEFEHFVGDLYFVLTKSEDELIFVWNGKLKGYSQIFDIKVIWSYYFHFPRVTVENPKLILNPKAKQESPLPHVYYIKRNGEWKITLESPLCLHVVGNGEWTSKMLIAETTILWTEQ